MLWKNQYFFLQFFLPGPIHDPHKAKFIQILFLYDVRNKHLHITLGSHQLISFSSAIEICPVIPFIISELHLCHLMLHLYL